MGKFCFFLHFWCILYKKDMLVDYVGDTMGIECVGKNVIDTTWLVVWNMNVIFPYI